MPGEANPSDASWRPGGLGCAIRRLRRVRGLTIKHLAVAASMHPTYLSGIERGVRNPSWHKLCGLADAVDVPLATLAREAEQEAVVACKRESRARRCTAPIEAADASWRRPPGLPHSRCRSFAAAPCVCAMGRARSLAMFAGACPACETLRARPPPCVDSHQPMRTFS